MPIQCDLHITNHNYILKVENDFDYFLSYTYLVYLRSRLNVSTYIFIYARLNIGTNGIRLTVRYLRIVRIKNLQVSKIRCFKRRLNLTTRKNDTTRPPSRPGRTRTDTSTFKYTRENISITLRPISQCTGNGFAASCFIKNIVIKIYSYYALHLKY